MPGCHSDNKTQGGNKQKQEIECTQHHHDVQSPVPHVVLPVQLWLLAVLHSHLKREFFETMPHGSGIHCRLHYFDPFVQNHISLFLQISIEE